MIFLHLFPIKNSFSNSPGNKFNKINHFGLI